MNAKWSDNAFWVIAGVLVLVIFGVLTWLVLSEPLREAERRERKHQAAIEDCAAFATALDVETRYVDGWGCYQRVGDAWIEVTR